VPEARTVLLGARDLDVDERALLDSSSVHLVDVPCIRKHGLNAALEPLWARIQAQTERAYLHLDLDVLDPSEARVNHFPPSIGLTLTELLGIVRLVRERCTLAAAAITAYDPEYDEGEKAVRAAAAVIRELSSPV
jgi:arginase